MNSKYLETKIVCPLLPYKLSCILSVVYFFQLFARPVYLTKRHHMCVMLKCTVSTLLNISCYTPRMMSNEPENVKKAN